MAHLSPRRVSVGTSKNRFAGSRLYEYTPRIILETSGGIKP